MLDVSGLTYSERLADGTPAGLLVLHHGRGTDQVNLIGLADTLDPGRELHVVAPRAPFQLPGLPGYHWYIVPRVGHPDPESFAEGYSQLAAFHDELWRRTGIGPQRTVLGGFSQGGVMSYALGLGGDRPAPAGILAFSGFIPVVPGWAPDLASRRGLRVFIAHGRADPVIELAFAERAAQLLEAGGLAVEYHESRGAHQIEPRNAAAAAAWLHGTLALDEAGPRAPGAP
jgi:phospholipase/carboxylesterase